MPLREENPDEIVLEKVKLFHYEVMQPKEAIWVGLYTEEGETYHLNIVGENLKVFFSNESTDK